MYFEPVSPKIVKTLLLYLKKNNFLYHDIQIDVDRIPAALTNISEPPEEEIEENGQFSLHTGDILEENENPLDSQRLPANETMLISNVPMTEDISIAPGEGNTPMSLLTDEFCEELAHPCLFPTGKFGYKVERDIKLSPVKYFNQRLLNYRQKFASDSDYIFYALSTLQQLNLNSQINIALKKVNSSNMTAGMLSRNFSAAVKSFIAEDKGFQFMAPIKGTPAYWKKFLLEVLAMVKQLGLPTFFMTLSCADLRWNELISIIAQLKGENMTDDDIDNMSYFERCQYLNFNPVLLARHFQYRVEVFFKEIIVNGPLGKVSYHAIRVEFQIRGSPHIHSFLWVLNAPTLTKNDIEEYIRFIDAIVKAYVPDHDANPDLFNLVTTYQIHAHSKSCRKYKNTPCRYQFGRFFSKETIVATPLSTDLSEFERNEILQQRQDILDKVKIFIDNHLNPKTRNILFPTKENFEQVPTISDILKELEIDENEYYNALLISSDNCFQVHMKRPPNSCFVNNYFEEGLLAWEANIDIQPVFNHFKAVTYMCAYFSKCEDETSQAMKRAAKEAAMSNKSYQQQMRIIAKAFSTKRECSVQEAVYLVMPELWLRKTFPAVLFANSNMPEMRYRMCRSKEEIDELPEDSTDVFKKNMIDRYMDRPNTTFIGGKYAIVNSLCFAQFFSHYYLSSKNDICIENDCQPTILIESNLEDNHVPCAYPAVIPLMSSKDKLKCRKVKAVLRYHVPNENKYPERYAHHLLFMFYPFRNENDLKHNGSYVEKLNESGVLPIINRNRKIFEPFADLVNSALVNMRTNVTANFDQFSACENDLIEEQMTTNIDDESPEDPTDDAVLFDTVAAQSDSNNILADEDVNRMILSLNFRQREIFEVVFDWARRYIKNLSAKTLYENQPLHIFLTGAGGCGKSHLIHTLYQALTKQLYYRSRNIEKPKVLLVAPTGVAAININGTTIHTALGIPVGHYGKNLPRLSDKMRCSLRNKLDEVCVLIIDEISMVSNLQLFYIHLRLVEIFGCQTGVPFAGVSVIACGDLYQLPPVRKRSVYADYDNEWLNLEPLWKLFLIAELNEVMRQRGDNRLIDLLNNIRENTLDENDVTMLKSKFIDRADPTYPTNALHIFAENMPAKEHNDIMLRTIDGNLYIISAIDNLPKNVSKSDIDKALNRNQSETGGLAGLLNIKVNARVMLTTNIDISDRLINGQIGTIRHIKTTGNSVEKIYVQLDDDRAGLKARNTDNLAKSNYWIPLERGEAKIKLRSKKEASPVIIRTQFPLMLSWACTVHKVQGLSLTEAVISFNLQKQRSFKNGQMYVALSRVTSLQGLYLIGKFNSNAIVVDKNAEREISI